MSFGDAVRSGFDNYAQFDGRASRAAFWWWFLFNFLVGIAVDIVGFAIGSCTWSAGSSALALLLPNLSVGVRRLHDTDRTGWWLLIALIPLIGLDRAADLLPPGERLGREQLRPAARGRRSRRLTTFGFPR